LSSRRINLFIGSLFFLSIITSCTPKEEVDLILHNGVIHTLDANGSKYEAIAVKDGKIIAMGPEREILNGYNAAQYVDLEKKYVYPGFIDAHVHLVGMAQMKFDVNLIGTTGTSEIISRLQAQTVKRSSGWIVGRGWDQNDWSNGDNEQQLFEKLNDLYPDTPVLLIRIDGHAGIVNQAGIEKTNFNLKSWNDPKQIVFSNAVFTGVVLDNALAEIQKSLPPLSRSEMTQGLILAQQECISAGLTTIDEAGISVSNYQLIDSLQKTGSFHLRVYAMLQDDEDSWNYIRTHAPDSTSAMLKCRAVKLMVDGALGSRGACLKSPYSDLIASRGSMLQTAEYYKYRMADAFVNKWQVCTHAIGDSANKSVMTWYASILMGKNNRRWRIEHAQVVDELDYHFIRDLSLILSVQPTHAVSDGPWAYDRLGANRIKNAYAYRKLYDVSGMLALGTDSPVEEISPLRTFIASVFRTDMRNRNKPFGIEERLDPHVALYGMTVWPAIANFEENEKGTLEIGKMADFTVVSVDLFQATEEQIRESKIEKTVIGGKVFKEGVKK
jgi:predicted amidohydrolase YtcJ